MWIVTSTINQYDQEGDYFETGYYTKPTYNDLKKFFIGDRNETQRETEFINHLLKGGGRRDGENMWYYLTEIKNGEPYTAK